MNFLSKVYNQIKDFFGFGSNIQSKGGLISYRQIESPVNKFDFNIGPTISPGTEGQVYYDSTWHTLACDLVTPVSLQIGQEDLIYTYNDTASAISNGEAVYADGANANGVPTIKLAKADAEATYFVLGLATMTIAPSGYGFICMRGNINDVKTDYSTWAVGQELYLSPDTPGLLSNTVPTAGQFRVRVGRIMKVHDTEGRIYVRQRIATKLDDLSNVLLSSPSVDDVIRFNGSEWVNSKPGTISGGGIVSFYADDALILDKAPTNGNNDNKVESLVKAPTTTGEQVESFVLGGAGTILGEAYLYDAALGRTVIDSGVWQFNTYASVSTTIGGRVSSLTHTMYQVIQGTGTLTTTGGAGTSKTATASTGDPFIADDASADITACSYIQTPQGLYAVSAHSTSKIVTITVPATYSNETDVAYWVWRKMFTVSTGTITALTTNYTLYSTSTVQPQYDFALTDKIGRIAFAVSNSSVTVYYIHNGTLHASHFTTPLVTLHNNITGLYGSADYYHLSTTDYNNRATFGTVAVSGLTSVDAVNIGDTLTLEASGGISLSTNNTTKTVTIYSGSSGSGSLVEWSVTQNGHGFVAGDVLKSDQDGTYSKAQADSEANAEVAGVVSENTDENTFKICSHGKMTLTSHGFTGPALFLSAATAGLLTDTAPSTDGQVNKPVAIVIDDNTIEVLILRGIVVSFTVLAIGGIGEYYIVGGL